MCYRWEFGAEMQVLIQNDGPVTVQLESPAGPTDPKLVSSFDSQWKTCFNIIFYRNCQFCSSVTAWIVSGLYKPVCLASFFHASAVQTREATAAERKNTVQRLLRVQQREGSPALESGPQHQQRSRGRRVLWTWTIEYLTVHLQPQSTLRHLYTLSLLLLNWIKLQGDCHQISPQSDHCISLFIF